MSGGKIIAFSGPPGCGKTVLSVRTAAELAGTGKRTVLISLDNTVPSVPLIFPRLGHGDLKSIGEFLMSLDVDSDSLLRSAITVRNNPNLIFLGYMPGENILTYPEFSPARTVRLYESALSVADYVIVDTKSGFREDVLSDCAVSRADLRADIYNPDIRTMAYYTSASAVSYQPRLVQRTCQHARRTDISGRKRGCYPAHFDPHDKIYTAPALRKEEKMIYFPIFAGFITGGIGLSLIIMDILRIPTSKCSGAFLSASRQNKTDPSAVNVRLEALARFISGYVHLKENRKRKLAAALAAADKDISPERHIADCVVKASVIGIFAIPAAVIFTPAAPVILLAAVIEYSSAMNAPERSGSQRRESIEDELPLLCTRIESKLGSTRNVIQILSSYRENAGPELRKELTITIADMESGNPAAALSRLEARVGSPWLSDITRGLTAVLDGNNPPGYWVSLSMRLSDARRQKLRLEADKIPAKINRLSLLLLVCVIIIYITVIGGELIRSLGILFG